MAGTKRVQLSDLEFITKLRDYRAECILSQNTESPIKFTAAGLASRTGQKEMSVVNKVAKWIKDGAKLPAWDEKPKTTTRLSAAERNAAIIKALADISRSLSDSPEDAEIVETSEVVIG